MEFYELTLGETQHIFRIVNSTRNGYVDLVRVAKRINGELVFEETGVVNPYPIDGRFRRYASGTALGGEGRIEGGRVLIGGICGSGFGSATLAECEPPIF